MSVSVGDEVLIFGGVSWMRHGRVIAIDAKSYAHPFAMVRLYSKTTGRLLRSRTLVAEHRCASFGPPQKGRPCAVCGGPLGLGQRKYCSRQCTRSAANKRRRKR